MSEVKTSRMFFKDDWHCGHRPNFDCDCWKNIDIERDKKFLAWCFRDGYDKPARVDYMEHKKDPNAGSESRDRNLYHVDVKASLVREKALIEAFWHGFRLVWISADGKDKLSFAFEHNGVYIEKES